MHNILRTLSRQHRARSGVTMVELMIVTAILAFVITAMYQLILTTTMLSLHSQAWADLLQWSQRAINRMSNEVSTMRRLYGDDATGNAYLAALSAPTAFPRITGDRLPLPVTAGTFRRDTGGNEQTGNCLLFCRERTPFTAVLGSGETRRISVYSLVMYYLSPVNRALGPYARSLVLSRWESVEFADYDELTGLEGGEDVEVAMLVQAQRGIRTLWKVSEPAPSAAFFDLTLLLGTELDVESTAPVMPAYRPEEWTNTKVIENLGFGFAGVAWNRNGSLWLSEPVPEFGLASFAGDGFPNGFEVQVIGSTGARTIFMRLVVVEFVAPDRDFDSFAVSAIANAREF